MSAERGPRSKQRLVFLAVLLIVPMLWGAQPCAQWVCQPAGGPVVLNGTVDVTDPTQTGRIIRDGRPSSCTGKTNALQNASPVHYDAHTLANPAGQAACAVVDFDFSGCGASSTQVNAYSSFDPATPDTGLLGDPGFSSTSSGSFSFPLTASQNFTLVVHEIAPNSGCASYSLTVSYRTSCRAPGFDATNDGRADLTVFRPSDGGWYTLDSASGASTAQCGISTDIPVPGSYADSGASEQSVYRTGATVNTWFYLRNSGGFVGTDYGAPGDVPVPGDFDRDAFTDLSIFRPANGLWFHLRSSTGTLGARQWGTDGDQPVTGDFDGDFVSDFGAVRPNGGALDWYVLMSNFNFGFFQVREQFGFVTDKVVPADYDGDGKTDMAVWRPGTGTWYWVASSDVTGTLRGFQFGASGDVPQPADLDGDKKADFVVFRESPTPGQTRWWAWLSATGTVRTDAWGQPADQPVTAQNRIQ
jgi:hypothetical protein